MLMTRSLLLLLYLCLFSSPALTASNRTIHLAVANSTCSAIQQVGAMFEQRGSVRVTYLCKSSGRLAKGLTGKAITADIYISASKKWMDVMLDGGMVASSEIISPWGNRLVLAVSAGSELQLSGLTSLTSDSVHTVLIGDPGTAPFGRYAKQALESSGLWDRVKRKVVTKKHITLLADTLATADSETTGILFFSNTTDKHRIVLDIDDSLHEPIRYYAAPLKSSAEDETVNEMMRFLHGPEAKKVFQQAGFKVFSD